MSMFEKFKEIIGGGDYDEDFDDIDEVEEEEEEVEEVEPIISKQRGNKVVNIHNSASAKVMVVKPASYDEAREIAEAIKNRKIVVVICNCFFFAVIHKFNHTHCSWTFECGYIHINRSGSLCLAGSR